METAELLTPRESQWIKMNELYASSTMTVSLTTATALLALSAPFSLATAASVELHGVAGVDLAPPSLQANLEPAKPDSEEADPTSSRATEPTSSQLPKLG